LGLGRLVLQDIPVLRELAALEADHVGGDPGGGSAMSGKSPVGDDVVAFREDQLVLVAERVGKAADEIEQAVAARRDVGAVLDVALRPEALGGGIVPLVEQRIEAFQHERLVLFG
jgi:hypothetical protein